MSVIDEVKQRIDIVEVASQYTKLIKAGRNFRGLCPLHSEKNPSFFVYPDQQSWHCFGSCNTGGDAFALVMKKQGIGFGEALQLLADRVGIYIAPKSTGEWRDKQQEKLYSINKAAAEYFHNLLISSPSAEKVRNYVARRGLSLKTVADFQLGFSPNSWEALKQHLVETGYSEDDLLEAGLVVESEDRKRHDRFRNRLMFPIHDSRGHTIGFGARALDDSMPKYLNSPQTPVFNKSSVLYAIDLALPAIRQQEMVVIVEGYMDVITAHQNGFSNVVASMGTAVTEKQIKNLKKLAGTKNIALALDADAAGEDAMLRLIEYKTAFDINLKIIKLGEGKDPDNIIKEDTKKWQQLVKDAEPVSDIDRAFDIVTSKLDLTKVDDKSTAINKLIPIIAAIKNDYIRQDHYLQRLSKKLGVDIRKLESLLQAQNKERRTPQMVMPVTPTPRQILAEPIEEYCLALLLQHPELKEQCQRLSPEYFADTVNREVFVAYMRTKDVKLIKRKLDSAFHEYIDYLMGKEVPANKLELRLADYALRLREKHLRSLQDKNTEALVLARESGGSAAELAKLEEQGTEISTQLAEVFSQKSQPRPEGKGG